MSDPVDVASEIAERELERQLAASRAAVVIGEAGECWQCECSSPRLVGGRCAPCRDGRSR